MSEQGAMNTEVMTTPTPISKIKSSTHKLTVKRNEGKKEPIYADIYNSQDDPIPESQIIEIPFPKTNHPNDSTAMKGLVIAPSRIGLGYGVYTLVSIPKDTIIMDFFDETNETITRDMVLSGIRDTSYMYANHKTSTYIDAINNKSSY